ncbi:MAG TPA: hypothetical protein PKW95_18165 [bacterium]|nr:hypothetical protein [bacterium]
MHSRALLCLLLAAALLLPACGLKGKLIPRDKLENEETGMPDELRLYPPKQTPADALGVGDAMQGLDDINSIRERELTPTPPPADESEDES